MHLRLEVVSKPHLPADKLGFDAHIGLLKLRCVIPRSSGKPDPRF